MHPGWRERILWNPSRPIRARPAWAAIFVRLALAPVFLIIAWPIRQLVPQPHGFGAGNSVAWSGSMTSTVTASNGSTMGVSTVYRPPEDVQFGFVRPYALASLSAVIATSSGTWTAPDGTPQEEVISRGRNAGVSIGPSPYGPALLQLPGRAATEFFGVSDNLSLTAGTHRTMVWSAVAFDAVLGLGWLMPLYAALAAARMFLTTREERRALRLAKGLCPRCRYERAGLGEGAACPECGEQPIEARRPTDPALS